MSDSPGHHSSSMKALTLGALGVVFGDIGTSPLYAIKEVFGGAHHPVPITPDNVLGVLSLFLWSLIIVVTLKYVAFIMRADNKGEGGIIALMTLALLETHRLDGDARPVRALSHRVSAPLFCGQSAQLVATPTPTGTTVEVIGPGGEEAGPRTTSISSRNHGSTTSELCELVSPIIFRPSR